MNAPDQTTIAFYIKVHKRNVPGWYARTYMLALAFAPFIAGLAGLFNYDCAVWIYSTTTGFKPVVLTKREP